ncbi:hypothetical protein FQN50_008748 [Emmonsiellopsis sp. PD_5]|nr:hypothetical protein FQN50_008748 [Emmonsiellopsis sp. PD_5]
MSSSIKGTRISSSSDAVSDSVHDGAVIATPASSSEEEAEEERKNALLSSFTAAEDKATRRKVDWRFLPLIGMMYIIKNVDYTNAAAVKVLQVGEDRNVLKELNMTPDQYNWISYIIFEVPSNMLLKRFTPRNWQSRIMLSWGIVLACHAAVQSKESMYALRFLLGMCEAGMFPGIAAQLCGWYRSDEMGKPIMWMFAFQNCSGIVGSLLAYGISYMNGLGGLSAWRWVYLLEGLFTILFSALIFLILPDWPKSPRSSSWLTAREQSYLELRLSENAPRTSDPTLKKSEILSSLKDPRTYAFMLSQLLVNFGGYALSWELPTITTNLGFAGLPRNQLLNIPPAVAAVSSIIFAGWFMKRAYLTRPAFIMLVIMGPQLVFFIVLATAESKGGIYVAWRSSSLIGTTGTAFTLAFQSCVGQVGGVIAPQLFQARFAYNGYRTPFAICAAAIGAACLANLWTWWLTRNVEWDVRRVRRLRIKEEREGRVLVGEDVRVFEERVVYRGWFGRGKGEGEGRV